MRTLFFCLIFVFNCSLICPSNFKGKAFASTTYYAQIVSDNVALYQDENALNTLFILPNTYFVELLSSANQNTYQAKYNDVYGYVKKDQVKPIVGVPTTPYLTNISFRIFVPSGANLRSTPQNLGAVNLLYSIPFLETNLLYYGVINGEESISKKGTTWYYCKYYMNNSSYLGYVYAPLCDCLSEIKPNTEQHEYMQSPPTFKEDVIQTGTTNALESLSSTAQTIIIIAISLPCLLFIYLLFKPTKIAQSESASSSSPTRTRSKKQKPKISRLKHSDYFEIEDEF